MVVVVVVGVRDVVTDTVTLSTYIVRCITLHCKCVLNCAVPVLVPYCTRVHLGTISKTIPHHRCCTRCRLPITGILPRGRRVPYWGRRGREGGGGKGSQITGWDLRQGILYVCCGIGLQSSGYNKKRKTKYRAQAQAQHWGVENKNQGARGQESPFLFPVFA